MKTRLAACCGTVGLASMVALAAPPPPLPMSSLVQRADLIITGSLEAIRAQAKDEVTEYTATLRVDRVIVGEDPGAAIPVSWSAGPLLCDGSWYLQAAEGKRAVWLLQKTDDGGYYWWHPDQIWFYEPILRRYPTVAQALTKLRSSDGTIDPKARAVMQAVDEP